MDKASTDGGSLQSAPRELAEGLVGSRIFRDYQQAFTRITGLPLALRSPGDQGLPFHTRSKENPFCAWMARRQSTCAICLKAQAELRKTMADRPQTVTCAMGLMESAVPVRNGNQVVALLETGQVFRKPPSSTQFEQVSRQLRALKVPFNEQKVAALYFATPVVETRRYSAALDLLAIFATQLSTLGNEIRIRQENAESPVVTRAKGYIEQHDSEDISLPQVARAVSTSPSYLCRLFRKGTGIRFTEYLRRVRLARAQRLLLNPNLRVSEVAFAAGFRSLTQFNRAFHDLLGQSPSEYRSQLSTASSEREFTSCSSPMAVRQHSRATS